MTCMTLHPQHTANQTADASCLWLWADGGQRCLTFALHRAESCHTSRELSVALLCNIRHRLGKPSAIHEVTLY